MAINRHRGYALVISVIMVSLMLSFGLSLGSLAFKQQALASGARESQYAFYAADTVLECGLYANEQLNSFAVPAVVPAGAPSVSCNGLVAQSSAIITPAVGTPAPASWTLYYRFSLDANKHCGDITVVKGSNGTSQIYAQGYNTSCAVVANPNGAQFVARGIYATN